jgi:ribonuclease-3
MNPSRQKKLNVLLNNDYFQLGELTSKSLELYHQALTHASYAKEQRDKGIPYDDFERLEFLGNFVLGLVISEYLYRNFDYSEGGMTKRMAIVSDAKIAEIIKKKEIQINKKHILVGKRELKRGKEIEDSIIACAFEALIGAIYLDRGLKKAQDVIIKIFSDEVKDFELGTNYIGQLQELVQQKKLGELEYIEHKLTGPDHKPTFKAVVKLSGKKWGTGTGRSKKAAKMAAARAVLKKLSPKEKRKN